MAATIELLPAFVFDCEKCGLENFVRCVNVEFSPDEMAEMRWRLGIDPLEGGVFLTSPKKVVCSHCGEKFDAVQFDADNTAD